MHFKPSFYRPLRQVIQTHMPLTPFDTVQCYWQVGQMLSQEERAKKWDKKQLREALKRLSGLLSSDLNRRLTANNLRNMHRLYVAFPDKKALRAELTWLHYLQLSRVDGHIRRSYYLQEAAGNHWSAGQLARQVKAQTFERLLTMPVRNNNGTAEKINTLDTLLKDPYLFEFLQLPDKDAPSEKVLLKAMLGQLDELLQELGPGFAFVAHQQRISTRTGKQFFIDLVFYHYLLQCFVLIDLKTRELTHGDIGQMDMYVRLYDDLRRRPQDNPTIGMILCPKKDPAILKYSSVTENSQLYAPAYKLILS